MHVIFDIQHVGRPDKPGDMGASFDLDGDGVRGEDGEREVDLVRLYVAEAMLHARTLGHTVTTLMSGTYGQRHQTAVRIAYSDPTVQCVYLACHTNAGGGAYGLLRPDYRSPTGARLAERMADTLEALLPELSKVRVEPLYPDSSTAQRAGRDVSDAGKVGWWTRGWSCIDGVYSGPSNLCGILVEPFFIDSAVHRGFTTREGCARVGRALVEGIV